MRVVKKLAQLLHETLPANRRVYFLYTHKNGFDRFYNGLKANTEISYWCYKALRHHFPRVRFLRFQDEKPQRLAKITSQDVVIGHIGESFEIAATKTSRLITFGPWVGHPDRNQEAFNCYPKEVEMAYYDKAAAIILLTSEFNTRTYLDKPTNYWYPYFQNKRVRVVHQPIDLSLFKRLKWEYSTSNFLYIGNRAHMKGVEDAEALVKSLGRTLHTYGFEGRKIDHRDPIQVGRLPGQADFFIQPGMWEAQCVSILEAAARGFIPVVTPETGYPYDHPYLLKYGDNAGNRKVLQTLLQTSPEERKELADHLHSELTQDVHHNHWGALTDVLVEEVQNLFLQRIEV